MKNSNGYIAMFTVVILIGISLVAATTVAFLAIGELGSSFALSQGENALHLVEGCTEDGLLRSRSNASYSSGTISIPEGSCSVTISKNGNIWTMTVSNTDTRYQRTIQTVFTRTSSGITLTSWMET